MHESAPKPLVDLLAELRLALPAEVDAVAGRAGRLARGLPLFEQVWVDALAQARVLTFFQAAEINAGRGRQLGLGPMVLCEPLEDAGYAQAFRARQRDTGRPMRLYVLPADGSEAAAWSAALAELLRKQVRADHPAIQPVESFGFEGQRFWIACQHSDARPVAQWLLQRGRMPPTAVHELARQLAGALAVCHAAGIAHGDLGPRQLLIDRRGQLLVPMPGVRPIVRPTEGFASAALAPETYDYLAPQRIAEGTPADLASDIYACGALGWHLLAGRPPIAGASGLAKMRATLSARIASIGPIAPDADRALVAAIGQCLARNPVERPASFAVLAGLLGEAAPGGRRALARCALFPGQARLLRAPRMVRARRFGATAASLAGAAALLAAVLCWPYWGHRLWPARRAPISAQRDAWISHAAEAPAPAKRAQPNQQPLSPPGSVVRATYESPLVRPGYPHADVIELGAAVKATDLVLRRGLTLRPRTGRTAIEVGDEGWLLAAEGLTFENIDFVRGPAASGAAMLVGQVASIRFSGCSWQLPKSGERSAAIDWRPPAEADDRLDSAELELDDCLFRDVTAALQVAPRGTLAIDFKNSLHLGPGPLVKLDAPPRADEQVVISASHLTLRDCDGLLQCPAQATSGAAGSITIRAEGCALVPRATSGLLVFAGDDDPAEILAGLRWLGQGSVVGTDVPLAVWSRSQGRRQAAAEDAVQVAGLVRSALGFAGDREQGATASRVVRWQVPLQSADPPGILETRLPASAGRR